jgi:hypothetical protein
VRGAPAVGDLLGVAGRVAARLGYRVTSAGSVSGARQAKFSQT